MPAYVDTLIQLRDALAETNVKSILDAYLNVRGNIRLGGEDVAAIAQALHTALRRYRPEKKDDKTPPEMTVLADLLVADIGAHSLPPNHTAHLHLLAFYKEARQLQKGADFWAWLESQDDSYVSPAVYGAAIELLAVQGRPAEETENLYTQALKRFPGSFNEYHLSPQAVLPNRSQPFNLTGIPVTLLQGILTARLLRGDIKNAYMALDTALRLFPTQLPSRFFTLFVTERPVPEAYKVFMIACRSGIPLGPDSLKALLTKLRHVAVADPIANASVLRSMITASYAYAAAGASLSSTHLTEIVIAVTSILKHRDTQTLATTELQQLVDPIMLAISKLFATWVDQGARPGIAAFNSIITNLAGKGKREDILKTCLDDMQELELEPSIVTRRSLVIAAGDIGNPALLRSAWYDLLDERHKNAATVDFSDWQALAKASRLVGEEEFVRLQVSEIGDALPLNEHMVGRIQGLLAEEVKKPRTAGSKVSVEQIRKLIDNIMRDAQYMDEQLATNRLRNFRNNPLPMSLASDGCDDHAQEQELRHVYDELTTDTSFAYQHDVNEPEAESETEAEVESDKSSSLDTVQPLEPALSTTGFDYAELRFQNWKTMNELLAESAKRDSDYIASVDAAIMQGKSPPQRDNGWKTPDSMSPSIGLSDLNPGRSTSEDEMISLGKLRAEVLRLRRDV